MKDLRDRCENIVIEHRAKHCRCCRNGEHEVAAMYALVDQLESFAREIRNEALEEVVEEIGMQQVMFADKKYKTDILQGHWICCYGLTKKFNSWKSDTVTLAAYGKDDK